MYACMYEYGCISLVLRRFSVAVAYVGRPAVSRIQLQLVHVLPRASSGLGEMSGYEATYVS